MFTALCRETKSHLRVQKLQHLSYPKLVSDPAYHTGQKSYTESQFIFLGAIKNNTVIDGNFKHHPALGAPKTPQKCNQHTRIDQGTKPELTRGSR